ncbi:MAG: hypothetical protein ICV54_27675 [Nostoc sp. C3-bin3]|nr:hypothetical protein [Nostoc sp. C3-bin3]
MICKRIPKRKVLPCSYKQYDEAIATVTHNLYQLAADIYGIGFLTKLVTFTL